MQTRNRYSYPVSRKYIGRMAYSESPAHTGNLRFSVDFIVEAGTPVMAAAPGKVVDVKANGRSFKHDSRSFERHGNFVEVYHQSCDEYSEYEHLESVSVKPGQSVRRGQEIGRSGATGWLGGLGPHLHFMVGVYRDYHTLRIRWVRRGPEKGPPPHKQKGTAFHPRSGRGLQRA